MNVAQLIIARFYPFIWLRQMVCAHEWESSKTYRACRECARVQVFGGDRWRSFTVMPGDNLFPWERSKALTPTLTIWQHLGFTECRANFDLMPPAPWVAGQLQLEVYATLDWKDRVRMLISGKVMLSAKLRTSVEVPFSESVSAISVLAPNHKRG